MSSVMAESSQIKHDWYQTETHVIVAILSKGVQKEGVKITCDGDPPRLQATFTANGEERTFAIDLAHSVSFESYRAVPSKVEVKLKKKDELRWSTLEKLPEAKKEVASAGDGPPKFPTSCPRVTDWDAVVADISRSEENEPSEGQAALNTLFQDIYSKGSDETRRAMNKSFQESGGTVLSTNWKEVEKDKITVKAPDGMEWKNWD